MAGIRKRTCLYKYWVSLAEMPREGKPTIQTWDPATYARNARFVSELGSPVLDLLAPRAGERILDLGCGDGVLSKKLVEAGCPSGRGRFERGVH